SQAVIEFDLQGNVLGANENFLRLMGYSLQEIQGKHHGMFVEPEYRASDEYRRFWEALRRGEDRVAQFKRLTRNGSELWLQASYSPVLDSAGRPYKVLKLATDITEQLTLARQMQNAVAQTEDVINSATAGDLSRRVDTTGTSGDVRKVGESINRLLGT